MRKSYCLPQIGLRRIQLYVFITTTLFYANILFSQCPGITGEKEVVYSNVEGEIMRPIWGKKINDRISYNFKLEKNTSISKGTTYNRVLDKEGKYIVSDELDLSLDKMDVGLDKIIQVMNEYPTIVVELGSHTDCRESIAKNQELSQKRTMASVDYIKSQIQTVFMEWVSVKPRF